MPFPAPRIRPFVSLSVLLFLHRKAPSCWPPFECLPQQFQKNAYHHDKCVISEPVQTSSPPGFMPLGADKSAVIRINLSDLTMFL